MNGGILEGQNVFLKFKFPVTEKNILKYWGNLSCLKQNETCLELIGKKKLTKASLLVEAIGIYSQD